MKIRTKIPKNNKYYIRQATGGLNGAVAGYPTISGANVLANCVGYANGRFNEIINDPDLKGIVKRFRYQLYCNAENFIESAKRQGLKISSKPTVGGIMVWQKGSTLGGGDGAGHVAIVEQIYKDGSIYTSESGWGSREWAFKNLRRNNENGRWGQNELYRFRGCIVNPSISGGPVDPPKLVVDGIGGTETVYRMQEFFETNVYDGVISGQNLALKKYYPSLTAVQGGSGGSPCIKKLQRWVGASQDGVLGEKTVKAWQKKLNVDADGIFGVNSMKAWQKYLNSHSKPVYPPDPKPRKKWKVIDISEFQDNINWAKAKADGVQGAIIRCGLRGAGTGTLKTDSMFLEHIKGAYKAGLPVGIYMFTEAINAKEGKEEADYAIKLWQKANLPISFPIGVDSENVFYKENGKKIAGRANDTKLSRAKRTEAIKAFCERIKEKGYTPMIYASTSWLHNQLDMSKLPYDVWVAQYNDVCEYEGKYVMWQYTSEGRVAGASGNIDMNHCYIAPKAVNPPKSTPTQKKSYSGTFPSYKLVKTNAQVIADAVKWAKWIAGDNRFHYGYGKHSHHNGCFFCGTQHLKRGHGIKNFEYTYCCNPFVGAAWAHGGCVPEALKLCEDCDSWDFGTEKGSYEKSKLFDKVSLKSLKKGDVLCSDRHVALYIGNGKVVQAGHEDDNVEHSKSWNDSIAVGTWDGYKRAYRFNGKVDAEMPLKNGEYSTRVADLQRFLVWYGYKISVTSFFNESTLEAVKAFQKEQKLTADGIVGAKTIEAMKKVKK